MYKIILDNKIIGQTDNTSQLIMVDGNLYEIHTVNLKTKEAFVRPVSLTQAEPYVEPKKIIYEIITPKPYLSRFIELESEVDIDDVIEIDGEFYRVTYAFTKRGVTRISLKKSVPVKAKGTSENPYS